jgi:hypothetical protein
MKQFFLIATFLMLSVAYLFAQEIEIKDNKVLLDGKPILKSERINPVQYSFYSLDSGDEVLVYRGFDNETPKNANDDYFVLNFLIEKKKVESTDFSKITSGLGMSIKKNMQKMIAWLIKEKVLTNEGKINHDKLDIFVEKYNENIVQRTIR